MSIPRDLKVEIPGYGSGQDQRRLRAGRPAADAAHGQEALRRRHRRGLPDQQRDRVDFGAFRRAVNYIGGVYVDIDRRLLQRQTRRRRALRDDRRPARLPEAQGPGRARLRPLPPHRQRLHPRRAPAGLPAPGAQPARRRASCSPIGKRKKLARLVRPLLRRRQELRANEGDLLAAEARAVPGAESPSVNEVRFPATADNPTIDTRLFASPTCSRGPSNEFMHAEERPSRPRRSRLLEDKATDAPAQERNRNKSANVPGLEGARPEGEDQAIARRARKLEVPLLLPDAAHDRAALRGHRAAALHDPRRAGQAAPGLPARALRRARTASTTASRA